jgi:UDP-N-acetyl-D-mannosaminuronate dehydrogenase
VGEGKNLPYSQFPIPDSPFRIPNSQFPSDLFTNFEDICMHVCVIGTGYVGLVTGTCLAHIGHHVICVDNNEEKVKLMKSGHSPIFEPGLSELMSSAI